ncbi:MAG: CPBP family glutamic-type intramembrane protease, partial [Thermoplasmata archaeon]
VCSFARTFKEAQNYVTPVILAVLIPGGLAAMPATRLEGVMLVMPVGNMVLLARDFLLGAVVSPLAVAMVLISTTLYAAASVAVAANVFGQETVVFSDAGSWKTLFSRRYVKRTDVPSVSMGLLVVALLFPLWFFLQAALSPDPGGNAVNLLVATAWLMPLLFVLVPAGLLAYWKVSLRQSLALRVPSPRFLVAGILIGLTAWIPSHEINVLQFKLAGMPQSLVQNAEALTETLKALPRTAVFLLIAVIPAVCEELLFRGFLFTSLLGAGRARTAILASAAIFAVFHFFFFKFAVAAVLGAVLAYLCWRSRSILPGMIAHALHNSLGAMEVVYPAWRDWIGLPPDAAGTDPTPAHLPVHVLTVGTMLFLAGIRLARGREGDRSARREERRC